MKFDPATQTLAKAVGILAQELFGTNETQAVTVYRKGTFLRHEIEAANDVEIPVGDALDCELSDLQIHLEDSYEAPF